MLSREKKILLVDDEPTQCLLLSKMLEGMPHYQVIEAHNGLSALGTLRREQVDLIILDVTMPVMDGFETLAAIREDAELSHIAVIMCTAVNTRKEVVRILQQGVADYIVKPVNKQIFLQKVQRVLGIDEADQIAAESDYTQPVTKSLVHSVLIADEDPDFRGMVRKILDPYYDIIEANDGVSALGLALSTNPQAILLGKLRVTLDAKSVLSKLRSSIRQRKTKVYRIFSTASESIEERGLGGQTTSEEYHGSMIRTLDADVLYSRLRQMVGLSDLAIFRQESAVVVILKNYYPQADEKRHMLLRAIAMALDSDVHTVRFDLSDWASESMERLSEAKLPNEVSTLEIASRYLEDIITELKSLGIKLEVIGYTPPEGSSLAALLTDRLAELRQEYIDYLTPRIDKLQQYRKAEDVEAIIPLGQDLKNFGKEHGSPEIALLADMLIRESNNKHWNVIEALIQQLLLQVQTIEGE